MMSVHDGNMHAWVEPTVEFCGDSPKQKGWSDLIF